MKPIRTIFSTILLSLFVPGILWSQGFDYSVYGKELSVSHNAKAGRWMDVTISGNTLFAIGQKALYSFDISSPKNPILMASLAGLGNVRQLETESGFASKHYLHGLS